MADAEVAVALDHGEAGPAAELLQHLQRGALLHMPAGPGVAQVVEAQPGHAGAHAGLAPGVVADLAGGAVCDLHGFFVGAAFLLPARHREDPAAVGALLVAQHGEGFFVKGYGEVSAGLGLVGEDPGGLALHVDLLPAEQAHVGFAQAGGEAEGGHGAQVGRQLEQQGAGLLVGEPGDALGGLVHLGDGRHAGQPAAGVGVVQDLAQLGQVPVDGGVAAGLGAVGVYVLGLALAGNGAYDGISDVGKWLALEAGGEPAQAELDVFDAAQVGVLAHPLDDGYVPGDAGGFAEALLPPEIARKARGVFLRRAAVCGASAALNALAVDGDVDPKGAAGAAGVDAHESASRRYWVRSQSMTSASTST